MTNPPTRAPWSTRRLAGLTLLSGIATVALLAFRVDDQHIDLEVYRFGVQAWWRGEDVYGLLPPTAAGSPLPFIYPPFSLLLMAPFTVLPWTPAVLALYLVDVACLGVTLYLVTRHVWPAAGRRVALAAALLATPAALVLEPMRDTFGFGQINLVLMALVAVDCLAPARRWPRGLGVGLAAAIKLTPAAFVLFFLIRKDFRAAAVAVGTAAAATGIGILVDGAGSARYWFGGLAGAAGVSGSPFRTNQTLLAVLNRFTLPETATTVLWLGLALALLVLVAAAMTRADPAVAVLLCAGWALLASPTSWSHHWVWIAPALLALALLVARRWGAAGAGATLTAAVLLTSLFVAAPFHRLPGFDQRELDWSPVQQVVGSAYVLAGLLLVVVTATAVLRSPRVMSAHRNTGDTRTVGEPPYPVAR